MSTSIINPIQVGLCGWGDHDLYPPKTAAKDKLALYAGHFPVVEVDSTYHALQPPERMARWAEEAPEAFRFVVKAYREMTGHGRREGAPQMSGKEMFRLFADSVQPLAAAGKLTLILFQFPPWYDCTARHVNYIRRVRQALPDLPLAVEFRNRTWYEPRFRERTLTFLQGEKLVNTICDEPQAGISSIPMVPEVTQPAHALVRFHGRNVAGWNKEGRSQASWRDVRYAYRYSGQELSEWVPRVGELREKAEQVTLLFNNNSQGDAADNAKALIDMLGLRFTGLAPRQLGLL